MADVTISLPQVLLDFAEEQIESGNYADIGDYLRDLIRRDEAALDRLRAAIDEGDASGDSGKTFDEIMAGIRERHASRVGGRLP